MRFTMVRGLVRSVRHPWVRGRRTVLAQVFLIGLLLAIGAASAAAALGSVKTAGSPEFTFAPDRGLVDGFGGYGGQFNQHVYAKLSGPPPGLPNLETKVLALQPQFVRIFFNTSEWTNPDRMESFLRTADLAQRAQAQINITWQGSTFQFAMQNMDRFADVLVRILQNRQIDHVWLTLFNEPNSTRITMAQYEQVYRLLDSELRDRGVRDRVQFMGGDLVGSKSPLGQTQADWFQYLAGHMGDLLDAWSIHAYWDFWDAGKIERRLLEVRSIVSSIAERRPVYVTEFGVRGIQSFEGEPETDPGFWPDGTEMAMTIVSAFQEAWFMIRASQLSFSATAKWDIYRAKYDNGTQDYSTIGPGVDDWPLRPSYSLLRLMGLTTQPRGGGIVDVVASPSADPAKRLTAYVSPAGDVTIFGLDIDGGGIATTSHALVPYSVAGLPPNRVFRLLLWNGDGTGRDLDAGDLYSSPEGVVEFSAPLDAVFALTDTPVGPLPR